MTQRQRSSSQGGFTPKSDLPGHSRKLPDVELQSDWLTPPKIAAAAQFDPMGVYKQPDFQAAIVWAMQTSGKQDQELARLCNVDAATFSKIKSGQAYVPTPHVPEILEGIKNLSPMYWFLARLGFDPTSVRPQMTELERENERLRKENAELRQERAVITNWMKETR